MLTPFTPGATTKSIPLIYRLAASMAIPHLVSRDTIPFRDFPLGKLFRLSTGTAIVIGRDWKGFQTLLVAFTFIKTKLCLACFIDKDPNITKFWVTYKFNFITCLQINNYDYMKAPPTTITSYTTQKVQIRLGILEKRSDHLNLAKWYESWDPAYLYGKSFKKLINFLYLLPVPVL